MDIWQEVISHIFELMVLVTNAGVGYLVYYLKKKDAHKDNASKALALLLRREMNELYQNLREKDEISRDEFNEFEELYNVYHFLGGNGSGTQMYNKVKEKEING